MQNLRYLYSVYFSSSLQLSEVTRKIYLKAQDTSFALLLFMNERELHVLFWLNEICTVLPVSVSRCLIKQDEKYKKKKTKENFGEL